MTAAAGPDVELDVSLRDGRGGTDLTDRLVLTGSHVQHRHSSEIGHTASLVMLTDRLDWRSLRLELSAVLRDRVSGASDSAGLGSYHVSSATRSAERPGEWRVELLDLSAPLLQPAGQTVLVTGDTTGAAAVAEIAARAGVSVESHLPSGLLTGARVWPITSAVTWLAMINEVSLACGGRALRMSRAGGLHVDRWVTLDDLPDTIALDESPSTLLRPGAQVDEDLWATPSELIAVSDLTEQSGAAVRHVVAVRDQDALAQRGWAQRVVHTVDAASHTELQDLADQLWAEQQYRSTVVHARLTPTLALWDNDVVGLDAPSIGLAGRRAFVRRWQLPLDGADMPVELGVL